MNGYMSIQGTPSPRTLYQCVRWSKSTVDDNSNPWGDDRYLEFRPGA